MAGVDWVDIKDLVREAAAEGRSPRVVIYDQRNGNITISGLRDPGSNALVPMHLGPYCYDMEAELDADETDTVGFRLADDVLVMAADGGLFLDAEGHAMPDLKAGLCEVEKELRSKWWPKRADKFYFDMQSIPRIWAFKTTDDMDEDVPCEIVGVRSDWKEVILGRRVGGEVWFEVWKVEDLELSRKEDVCLGLRDKNGLHVPCKRSMDIGICPPIDPCAGVGRKVLVEMPFPEEPIPEIFRLYSDGCLVVRYGPRLNQEFYASCPWYSYRPEGQKIVFHEAPHSYALRHNFEPPFECLDVPEAILRQLGSGKMVLNVV